MVNDPSQGRPEWTKAIYNVVSTLMERGYLHIPNDVEFVRPGHKSVFPCGRGGLEGPLNLNQLKWSAEKGHFWFLWYDGSFLKLNISKGPIQRELKLDPTQGNVWEFVHATDRSYK